MNRFIDKMFWKFGENVCFFYWGKEKAFLKTGDLGSEKEAEIIT